MVTRLTAKAAITLASLSWVALVSQPALAEANRPVVKPIERQAFPLISLPQKDAAGQRAIDLLGSKLPEVAAWYGQSPDEFRSLILNDVSTRIDGRGRLFYVDHLPENLPLPTAPQGLIEGATRPLNETFLLHSKPGSKKTIYLDFNGATLTGTAWASNTIATAPAYTIDADPAFSNTELTNIQAIWRQVSEDFAPFDVDVTTEAPPASSITRTDSNDAVYGTVALITTKNIFLSSCGCGGVAYVGIYNMTSDYYKPALVLHDALANSNKYISEAVSHEVGHNIGLSHDGTSTTGYYTGQGSGVTGWAPIMGVGYYQALTQFSKGEYTDANQKQDDFAVAQSYGLPIRPLTEDVGDTIGSSAALTGTLNGSLMQATADGVIETAADKDVYAITIGAGTLAVSLSPVTTSPNLDAVMQIMTSTGQVVAQSNPVDALNASASVSLPAGTYFVMIDGTGKGEPLTTGYTDYGSVGWYRITASYPAPDAAAPVASFTATPTTGTAPLTVQLDASSSSDPNGNDTITAFDWTFGDTTTGTGMTTSHVFQNAGSYNLTLKVIDRDGLSSTSTKTIVVNPVVTLQKMYVSSLTLTSRVQKNGSWNVSATANVISEAGQPVAGAIVNGTWSGIINRSASATTNTNGVAVTTSPWTKLKGTIAYSITSITASGFTYEPGMSIKTTGSITR